MKILLAVAILLASCSIAGPGSHVDAVREPTADAGGTPCGNAGTVCADDEVCYHNNCLTLCGSSTCWAKLRTAYEQCGN